MYDAVIFDKDGVLLDSSVNNFLWMDKVRIKAAKERGYDFTMEDAIAIPSAKNSTEVEKILYRKDMSWDELEEIEQTVQDSKIKLIEEGYIDLFPGARSLLDRLSLPKSIVSNAPWRTTEFTVNHFDLDPYFREIKAPEMSPLKDYYQRKKPHPSMIEEVVANIGAENPVMVGDTSADIEAAENAGIDSILINPDGKNGLDPTHHVKSIGKVRDIVK